MIRSLLGIGDEPRRPKRRRPNRDGQSAGLSRRELLTLRRDKPNADGRWQVLLDPARCTDCGACVRVCPGAAMHRIEERDAALYTFRSSLCDGCGDCRAVCAVDAVSVKRNDAPGRTIESTRLELHECSRCRQRVAWRDGGRCLPCRQQEMGLSGGLRKP